MGVSTTSTGGDSIVQYVLGFYRVNLGQWGVRFTSRGEEREGWREGRGREERGEEKERDEG